MKDKEDVSTELEEKKSNCSVVLTVIVIVVGIVIGMTSVVFIGNPKNTKEISTAAAGITETGILEEEKIEEENSVSKMFPSFSESARSRGSYVEDASENEEEFGMLIPIPDHLYLFYAKGTGIVYIVQSASAYHVGYGYMAPFYSKNGNLYRYEDGFFTEVLPQA